uniref:Uncharacterized protein n=1 Tax=Arundo donax TaxID=35708 RepID=A0A0A9CEX0_ARUDO
MAAQRDGRRAGLGVGLGTGLRFLRFRCGGRRGRGLSGSEEEEEVEGAAVAEALGWWVEATRRRLQWGGASCRSMARES